MAKDKEAKDSYQNLKGKSFRERISREGIKHWVKFVLFAVLIVFAFLWTGAWWVLLFLPVVFDIYITKYVHWNWKDHFKGTKWEKAADWVDAIAFALAAVYLINPFLFQNYKIPSPSLEKTLLVGDFLFVSKVSYGPREPMTPLSFPLAQHTLPLLNCKSYIDKPQWEYKRLKGLGSVQRNDIVVFNFPAGDTVPLKVQNPDYYTLVHEFGRDYVWNHPEKFGEIVVRPVDRRENYVKRCVALPGDTLSIVDGLVHIDGKPAEDIEGLQFNYLVETKKVLEDKLLESLNVRKADRLIFNSEPYGARVLAQLGYADSTGNMNYVYHLPLTQDSYNKLKTKSYVVSIKREPSMMSGKTFPLNRDDDWTRDDYGPIWIPKAGATVTLTKENLPLYEQIIRNYERNQLEVKNDVIYINGQAASTYTFKMDYYWMMGDNRHNSADSRFWGFVPEDHIVGKPIIIWMSLDEDQPIYKSVRWSRLFTKVHPN